MSQGVIAATLGGGGLIVHAVAGDLADRGAALCSVKPGRAGWARSHGTITCQICLARMIKPARPVAMVLQTLLNHPPAVAVLAAGIGLKDSALRDVLGVLVAREEHRAAGAILTRGYKPRKMLWPAATQYHAVQGTGKRQRAVCGTQPRCNWSPVPGDAVTCPRCLYKMNHRRMGGRAV